VQLPRRLMRPLLAGALGVATLGALPSAWALDRSASNPSKEVRDEVVVTATRQSDAVITAKVVTALREDPYIFSDHVMVTTENGVVKLEGIVTDLSDLHRILRLARRIAGKGRVANQMELMSLTADHD